MQTFKKLPIAAPKTKTKAPNNNMASFQSLIIYYVPGICTIELRDFELTSPAVLPPYPGKKGRHCHAAAVEIHQVPDCKQMFVCYFGKRIKSAA